MSDIEGIVALAYLEASLQLRDAIEDDPDLTAEGCVEILRTSAAVLRPGIAALIPASGESAEGSD